MKRLLNSATQFLLVLVLGIVGAILSRARASGMRTTMLVVAGTQLLFGSLGFILLTPEMYSDLFLVTTFFAGIWTASAFLSKHLVVCSSLWLSWHCGELLYSQRHNKRPPP